MRNFEFYKDDILKIAANGSRVARVDGKPAACDGIMCYQCDFTDECHCGAELIEWLYAEHVEKPKISKMTKMFFEAIGTGWVARDKDGVLTIFTDKPIKNTDSNWWSRINGGEYMYINRRFLGFVSLDFIKWEDEEPWSVEDILKLEVED